MGPSRWTGGCACGALRFAWEGPAPEVANCHCAMCRRVAGAAVVAWASLPAAALQLQGEPRWWASSTRAERGFCPACGSSLFFRGRDGGPLWDVAVACLDQAELLAPQAELWTAEALPWSPLDPSLPQHADGGPDWSPGPPLAPAEGLRWQEGGPVDLHQLAALFGRVGFGRRMEPEELRATVDGARWVVSAWKGEELVAFGRAISDGAANAYISTVAVHPDHQRQGIGRALLGRLLQGRDRVKFVLRTSPAGEALYRSLGFVEADHMLVRPRR